jgi:hypothetical protein
MQRCRRARVLGGWLALLVIAVACGDGRPTAKQTPPSSLRPSLRIVAITDLNGYLQPCGCQSRPLGGLDKAATRLRELSADGVPALVLGAGNLLFGADAHDPKVEGAGAEAATQAQWQAEAVAKVLGRLSLAAAMPGAADLQHVAELPALMQSGRFALMCPGAAGSACKPDALIARGGTKVGLWGLGDLAASADASVFSAEAKRLTGDLRARGAEIVVGLWSGDARLARRIAGGTPGLDFLLQGGSDSPDVIAPERIGDCTLLRASHQGHGLLAIDVFREGAGPFVDVSAWTRKAQEQALDARISELAGRVGEWKRDPGVDRKLLAEQETRLAGLRSELAALRAPPRPQGNAFSAQFIELAPETSGDPDTRALIDAHNRRVNEHNRVALANLMPKPVAPGMPGYVGSARCGDCHEQAAAWWQGHAHGHAYATLEKRDAQFNLSCVGCHVTGYNRPGGATVVHNDGLINVGCESCHGPGSLHAKDPDVDEAKNVQRAVPDSVCKQCHTPEHSDRFEYATYKAKLIVPGHGLLAQKAAPQ